MNKLVSLIEECHVDDCCLSITTLDTVDDDTIIQVRMSSLLQKGDLIDFDYLGAQMVYTLLTAREDDPIGYFGRWLYQSLLEKCGDMSVFGMHTNDMIGFRPTHDFRCYVNKKLDSLGDHDVLCMTLTVYVESDKFNCDDLDCSFTNGLYDFWLL